MTTPLQAARFTAIGLARRVVRRLPWLRRLRPSPRRRDEDVILYGVPVAAEAVEAALPLPVRAILRELQDALG